MTVDRPGTTTQRLPRLFWPIVVLLLASGLGVIAFEAAWVAPLDRRDFEGRDWYRLLRVMGSLYWWLLVAACLWTCDHARRDDSAAYATGRAGPWPASRGVFVLLCALGGGAAAELLKLVVRRGKVDALLNADATLPLDQASTFNHVYLWKFDGLGGFFSTSNLGIPSSHAATAFGGAAAMAILFPRAWWPGLMLACGCAMTRVWARDHYVSDVLVGGAVGLVMAAGVWSLAGRGGRG